jgi:enoyl-CoA hydratase
MTTDTPLLTVFDAGVLTLSINDAPWNRMGFAYMDALEAALEQAATDPAVRVLLFTAEGEDNFSVGMDLKQLLREGAARGGWEGVLAQRQRVLDRIEALPKPSIATLFGHCLGGGLELPLACHFRLAASEGARIGLPEMELGTMPAWGGTARLSRCIGRDSALDMILRARKIDGAEALHSGLVSAVHPLAQLKDAALALARELAAMPALAVAGVLRCVVGGADLPLAAALAEERRAFLQCAASADQAEGMQAFLEKRKPVFSGH